MCGISGIISLNKQPIEKAQLKAMTDIISHRGPDGEGHWLNNDATIALGHRRLSIIDLSTEADQPMHYLDRYTIVFNGEIYNYIELKEQLLKDGYSFHTQSDTEVLIAMIDKYKEESLQYLDGMFSFVLFDKVKNTIFCARDRFGEKPFFFTYKQNEYFYFGSEMKCLWAAGIEKKINNRMLFNYISYAYLENQEELSETFYEGCTRLIHGHYLKIDLTTNKFEINKYYDIDWKKSDTTCSINEAKEKFNELFNTSVKRRLRSDVAVGSSLSGGLDSSLVVCTIDELKKGTNQLQKTFSAVFPGFAKDERKYMDYVIAKTKVEPHFVTPTDDDILKDLEKLSWHQEEPYGSASIYVQYRVMQLAKENNVTVLLDGQGADEILAGYHSYFESFFNELKSKNKIAYQSQYANYFDLHATNTINGITKKTLGSKIRQISPSLVKPIKQLKNAFHQIKNPVFNPDFFQQHKNEIFKTQGYNFKTLNECLYTATYSSGSLQQLLRFADRNSMAHSREVRLPFLNHELVEFLFTMPATMKINNGWTKWIMRETFPILPNEISWRKDKIGYEPPQKNWLDSKTIKDKINSNKQELIDKKILNSKIITNKNLDWRILSINLQ